MKSLEPVYVTPLCDINCELFLTHCKRPSLIKNVNIFLLSMCFGLLPFEVYDFEFVGIPP